MEERNDLSLQRLIKINQKVAAAHQAEPRKRWITRHIVPGKHAQISNGFGYLIVLVELDEEALQSLGRNFICNAVRIKAGAGFLDCELAQIGTENLNPGRGSAVGEILQEDDRDGIHLFSGGAAGDPNS